MTDKDTREFWEKCGFKYDHWGDEPFIVWPDGVPRTEAPPITLDNLFKYAVPRVKEIKDKEQQAFPSQMYARFLMD